MRTRSTRSRVTVRMLAAASAASFAAAAGASPASAAESGNHKDADGNLVNTELDLHCTAKIQKGFFPPVVSAGGTVLTTSGTGNCSQGTNFNNAIVDIQQLVRGAWVSIGVPGQVTTALQWSQASATGVGDTGACAQYRARTRVWRRADAGKTTATIAVRSASVYVGQGGICDKL